MEGYKDFILELTKSIQKHWDLPALTDYQGITLQYKDVARKIEKLHILFENAGIKKGDKIAICGKNNTGWASSFLSILTYGAVAVPILHEFNSIQVHNIINHSDTKILFTEEQIYSTLSSEEMPQLEGIINTSDFSLLLSRSKNLINARENLNKIFGEKYPKFFRPKHISYSTANNPEQLAILNYTSGTTSNSKGVLIPYRALYSNMFFAQRAMKGHIFKGSKVISMLPLAHMYGMSFELLYEMFCGCHVYFLTRIPSPRIVFQAFSEVKPNLIISVPLIIEKIIKKIILPKLQTASMKVLLKVPIVNHKIREKIREQLFNAFGGNFYEIIIGGAAFNTEIEDFLNKIGFNYTVGYGATECAPIITYEDWKKFKKGSCGKIVPNMEIKIDSEDPQNIVGEILVRGANVMLGYYKNEEATHTVIDPDGWYHTGDLGILDKEENLYIRGRSKNMLLGSSGQNIYPEEIEDKLNSLPYVSECIVIQKDNKLYGLVYPDYEEIEKNNILPEELANIMEENRIELNNIVNNYEHLSGIKIFDQEFEKTPKRSIKRYLYTNITIN